MAQYWIQTPVENAKEVIQRKIDELVTVGTLPDFAGYTVSYGEDCEVLLDGNVISSGIYDPNAMYFGTFVANFDNNFPVQIYITDINQFTTVFNWVANPPMAGHYPYIMTNYIEPDGWDGSQGYFFGYKFTLTAP
jgi:hypothetical protein